MSNFYLGLDLSLTSTGIAVIEENNGKVTLLESQHIPTTSKEPDGKRLDKIRKTVKTIYEKYEITDIIKEKSFSRFAKESQQIFKVVGLIEWTFRDIEIVEYAPTTIKKELTGSGRGSKEEVEEKVIEYLVLDSDYFVDRKTNGEAKMTKGKVKKKDDESDACAIILTHLIKEGKI